MVPLLRNKDKAAFTEIFYYIVFGILTTVVNIISYAVIRKTVNVTFSTAAAWFISVIFAYITNRAFVFHSRITGTGAVLCECGSFIASRLFSGAVDMGIMLLFIQILHTPVKEMYIKAGSNVVVIILNYIISKLIVFRKTEKE